MWEWFDRIVSHQFQKYPVIFFDKSPTVLFLINLFPFYFVAQWIFPILVYGTFNPTLIEIIIFVSIFIISIVGIYINWKYGLKRYEAFG